MKYIDIATISKKVNSKTLNRLPGFLIKLMEKIIWQDEINQIITKYSNYEGVDFLPKIVEELNLKVVIEGKDNLPENGRCVFVANHPFGFVDSLILTNTVAEKYGALRAIGNKLFMLVPNLQPITVSVNVFGKINKKNMLELDKLYASDFPITNFPHGVVSRIYKGKIQDNDWQKSFITKAISHKRDVVPIRFYGRNSRLFYFINIFRQIFGIKTNIELALLPHEMFKKRNKTIKVKIGKPIPWQKFDKTLSHRDWAQKVRMHVYNFELNSTNNPTFYDSDKHITNNI